MSILEFIATVAAIVSALAAVVQVSLSVGQMRRRKKRRASRKG